MGTFIYYFINIGSIISTLSFCHVRGSSYHNVLFFVQHPFVLTQINIAKCTQTPQQFSIQSPKLSLLFMSPPASDRGWHGRFPTQKALCESLIQSCLKQLPQPGSVPLRSSYIFCPNVLCVCVCHGCGNGTNRCSQLSVGWHDPVLEGLEICSDLLLLTTFYHHCPDKWGHIGFLLTMVNCNVSSVTWAIIVFCLWWFFSVQLSYTIKVASSI